MAMEYFCCYHSYRKKLAKLSNEEFGRLFRKLLEYSETGEVSDVDADISIAFDFISDDIDRAQKNYEEKCRKNRESGRKRTLPNATERYRTVSVGSERYRTQPNQRQRRNKRKNRTTCR